MKFLRIGIMPQEKIRERVLSIAKGEYRPGPGEPKIWFSSIKSLAEVLSDGNRALLKVIAEVKPQSISDLAVITGRKPSNLSRTLKTMSNYGLVELQRENRHVSKTDCPDNQVPDPDGIALEAVRIQQGMILVTSTGVPTIVCQDCGTII